MESHVSMRESCHIYEGVMSHIRTIHVSYMNESCHIYERVTTVWRVMSQWESHVSMRESCLNERVMFQWESHVSMRESCLNASLRYMHIYVIYSFKSYEHMHVIYLGARRPPSALRYTRTPTGLTYEWVFLIYIFIYIMSQWRVMSHMSMSHGSNANESCFRCECIMSQSHEYDAVVAQVWGGYGRRTDQSIGLVCRILYLL